MDVLTHSEPIDDEHNLTASPERTPLRTHLVRFAIVLLAVGAVFSLINRVRPDTSQPPAAQSAQAPSTGQTIADLEARAAAVPDDLAALQQLGAAYLQRGIETLDPSFNELAERAFDRADSIDPGAIDTVVGRAGLASTRHKFADSLVLAEQVLAENPYSAAALALRVDSELELGRYDRAEIHLQELADRQPGPAALARVSYFRELSGDRDGALDAISDAEAAAVSASAADRARYSSVHGDVLMGMGRPGDAARSYARALTIVDGLPTAVVGAARADAALGDVGGAIASLEALVQRTPLPPAAMLLAELYPVADRPEEAGPAIDVVRAFVQLERAAGSNVDLDLAVFEADNAPVTPESLERARAAAVERPSIYGADALAWTLFRSGDAVAALPFVEQSLRTGTTDAQILFHAASVFESLGDTQRATDAMTLAAATNPWFSAARTDEARSLAGRLGVDWPQEPPR